VERPVEIDREHLPPGVDRIFPSRHVRPRDAGVIDEDVDPPQRLERFVAGLLDGLRVRDVGRDDNHLPLPFEFRRRLVGQRPVAVPDRHRGAGGEQPLDDRPPNALRPAGDHSLPARQIDTICHDFRPVSGSLRLARLS
jgi:hypothetical protein